MVPNAVLYSGIADVYFDKENYAVAIENFRKALEVISPKQLDIRPSYLNLMMGTCFLKTGKSQKALEKFTEVIKDTTVIDPPKENTMARAKIGLAICHFKLDKTKISEKRLEELYDSLVIDPSISSVLWDLSDYYILIDKPRKAEFYLEKALEVEQKNKYDMKSVRTLELLSNVQTYQKKYKEAYDFAQERIVLSDSIKSLSDRNYIQTQNMIEEFIKEEHEHEKSISEKENEILKKNNLIILISSVAAILILLFLGYFVFSRYKQKIYKQKVENKLSLNKVEAIIEGEEEEKKQMSFFIHEKLSQDIISAKYNLDDLKLQKEDNVETVGMIKDCLDNSLSKLREITYKLAPPALGLMSIDEVLESYCAEISDAHDIPIHFEYLGEPLKVDISNKKQIAFYRIVQELIDNIIDHANAKKVMVQMISKNNDMDVTIEDNGDGYDKNWVEGFGWKKIKHRMSLLKATHEIISNENGTSIHIQMSV